MKYLLWGVIILAVVLWVLRTKKTLTTLREGQRKAREESLPSAESMVQCAHCGIHLPASEAVAGTEDQMYCSIEHRRLSDDR